MRGKAKGALRVTLPAVLAALGVLFLYLSSMAPTGRWGLVAVAGLLPAAAVVSLDLWAGFATYAVTGVLGFFLAPDKLNILLYLLFFGIYPMVKSLAEHIKPVWLRYLAKLAFFNGILTLFLVAFSGLFLPALPAAAAERTWLLYPIGSAVFLVYDLGFTKLVALYVARVDKSIKR